MHHDSEATCFVGYFRLSRAWSDKGTMRITCIAQHEHVCQLTHDRNQTVECHQCQLDKDKMGAIDQ